MLSGPHGCDVSARLSRLAPRSMSCSRHHCSNAWKSSHSESTPLSWRICAHRAYTGLSGRRDPGFPEIVPSSGDRQSKPYAWIPDGLVTAGHSDPSRALACPCAASHSAAALTLGNRWSGSPPPERMIARESEGRSSRSGLETIVLPGPQGCVVSHLVHRVPESASWSRPQSRNTSKSSHAGSTPPCRRIAFQRRRSRRVVLSGDRGFTVVLSGPHGRDRSMRRNPVSPSPYRSSHARNSPDEPHSVPAFRLFA